MPQETPNNGEIGRRAGSRRRGQPKATSLDLEPWLYKVVRGDADAMQEYSGGTLRAVLKLGALLHRALPMGERRRLALTLSRISEKEVVEQVSGLMWPFRALKALGAMPDDEREKALRALEDTAEAYTGADA